MFQIDLMSRKAFYEQLTSQVEKLILTGILTPNDQLPSVRNLSVKLSINPNTIQRAYNDLYNKGLIYTIAGKGSFVSENAFDLLAEASQEKLSDLESIIKEMYLVGIDKNKLISLVDNIYKGEWQID